MISELLQQANLAVSQGQWSRFTDYLRAIVEENIEVDQEELISLSLQVLSQGDFQVKWEMSPWISRLGNGVIAPLIIRLKDHQVDLEERWFICRILGQFNHPDALQALVDLLTTTEEEELSLEAANILGGLGSDQIDVLVGLLSPEESRFFATIALGQISSPLMIEPLLTVVNDPQPNIRLKAIESLGKFSDVRLIPVLINALKDPVSAIRKEAVSLLGNYRDVSAQSFPELNLVAFLKPLLWDINPEVVQQTILTLAHFPTEESILALGELLLSPIPPILQVKVMQSWGRMETFTALDYLHKSLQKLTQNPQPDLELIGEIMNIFSRVEKRESQELVTQIMIDWIQNNSLDLWLDNEVKIPVITRVIYALGQLGIDQGIPWLLLLLSEDEPSIQLHCIAALKMGYLHDIETLLNSSNLDRIYGDIPPHLHSKLDRGLARAREQLIVDHPQKAGFWIS